MVAAVGRECSRGALRNVTFSHVSSLSFGPALPLAARAKARARNARVNPARTSDGPGSTPSRRPSSIHGPATTHPPHRVMYGPHPGSCASCWIRRRECDRAPLIRGRPAGDGVAGSSRSRGRRWECSRGHLRSEQGAAGVASARFCASSRSQRRAEAERRNVTECHVSERAPGALPPTAAPMTPRSRQPHHPPAAPRIRRSRSVGLVLRPHHCNGLPHHAGAPGRNSGEAGG